MIRHAENMLGTGERYRPRGGGITARGAAGDGVEVAQVLPGDAAGLIGRKRRPWPGITWSMLQSIRAASRFRVRR